MRSIRLKIVLFVCALLIFTVIACVASSLALLQKSQRAEVLHDLGQARENVDALLSSNRRELESQVKLVGVLPILRAVVDTKDAMTIKDSAEAYRADLKLALLDVFDGSGKILSSVGAPYADDSPELAALVKAAAQGSVRSGLILRDQRIALIAAGPIGNPPDIPGVLVLGVFLDGPFAARARDFTKADITFFSKLGVSGSSLEPAALQAFRSSMPREARAAPLRETEDYLLQIMPLDKPQQGGEPRAWVALQFSLAEAKATQWRIAEATLGLGAAVLLIAVFLGFLVAASLSKPIASLKAVMEKIIATDDLSQRAKVAGKDETAALAVSFNHLIQETQQNRVKLEDYSMNLEKKVEQRTSELKAANTDMTNLLENLGQGFMLFGADATILPGSSRIASRFFGGDPTGRKISELFQLDGKDEKTVPEVCQFAFSEGANFAQLKPLMPSVFLKVENRHIELDYRPIYASESRLEKIICIASDKTQEVELNKIANQERALARFLTGVAKNRGEFIDFIADTRNLLNQIRAQLGAPLAAVKAGPVFAMLHTIKGNTASYHMDEVSGSVHGLEERFSGVLGPGSALSESDVQVLLEGLNAFEKLFDAFLAKHESVLGKIEKRSVRSREVALEAIIEVSQAIAAETGAASSSYRKFVDEFVLDDFSKGFEKYREVVANLAERLGKKVRFELNQAGVKVCLDSYSALLSSCVHIFRNALDHGIEAPRERSAAGKPDTAQVEVSFSSQGSLLEVVIRDDGRGIDVEKVRAKAVERGLVSAEDASSLSPSQLMQFLFMAGFSTASQVTELSGRGVGLDAVMTEAKQLGGSLWVESEAGVGSRFRISVPVITAIPKF